MAAPSTDGSPPWANLPVELVDAVVEHLDVFSATRLAAVCSSWAAAVATNPALPFGTPCLLMTGEDQDADYEEDTFQLMDLTREERVSPPALVWGAWEQWWVGGKDDWLATVDDYGNAQLVNPYSGQRIDLPDISTVVPGGAKARDTFGRIVVCETPSDAGGYLVIAVLPYASLLAVARGGDDEGWSALRNLAGSLSVYSDAVAHRGKVFAVDRTGCIHAWDIRPGACPDAEPELTGPPHVDDLDEFECRWRLAESADGCRLLLVCTYGREITCHKTKGYRRRTFAYTAFQAEGVRLYERDVDAGAGSDDGDGHGWSPVVSLGDHSLFLGANCPFLARVVNNQDSSGSKWHQQLRANCVCVTNNQSFRSQDSDTDMEIFDLGDVKYPYRAWKLFHSDRYHSFQTPMWFRPMLKNYELE